MLPTDLEVDSDPLQLRIDFYRESVLLRDYATKSKGTTRLVSALDVAHALAQQLDLSSGVLPQDALWYSKTASGERIAIWCPAMCWTVKVKLDVHERYRQLRLPMPGLVFITQKGWLAPFVFAAKARPEEPADMLYHCPAFNVFRDGRVCRGSHNFPTNPSKIPGDFFRSNFSLAGDTHGRSRAHPEDLAALWNELHRKPEYPLDDLVPALSVVDAMRVGA